jgi:hypothetical protein
MTRKAAAPQLPTRIEEIERILSKFAHDMHMTIREFCREIDEHRTGQRDVGGNDGVKLGTAKVKRYRE